METAKVNSQFNLTYRDGSNYKAYEVVVLSGRITQKQVDTLKTCVSDHCFIIAHQVGLPTPAFQFQSYEGFPADDFDHVWTILFEECTSSDAESMHTDVNPTLSMSVAEFVSSMEKARGNWNVAAEWARMNNVV